MFSESRLKWGWLWIGKMSRTMISARFPTSRLPVIWSRCKTSAPILVAISKTCRAGRTVGSPATGLAIKLARRISSNMSKSLFEAAPSVPMPTFAPISIIRAVGAKPDASFKFELGLWAIPVPARLMVRISPSSTWTQCAAISLVSNMPNFLM